MVNLMYKESYFEVRSISLGRSMLETRHYISHSNSFITDFLLCLPFKNNSVTLSYVTRYYPEREERGKRRTEIYADF